jgi:hypothetical protein
MKEFKDTHKLLERLQEQFGKLNERLSLVEQEHSDMKQKVVEAEQYEEQVLNEAGELQEILKNCTVDVCQYKTSFEEIRNRQSGKTDNLVTGKKFHFFLCYRGDYYSRDGKTVIEAHQDVIEKHGFCWWGKFFQQRLPEGGYRELEPFGESISPVDATSISRNIKRNVAERLAKGDYVYLYTYNPNPPNIKLYVCNVTDFYYGEQKVPYEDSSGDSRPQCAYIPEYYFVPGKRKDCTPCKKIDRRKCKFDYLCNFWFKIDEIKELTDIEERFTNLQNCFTDDSINFAIPILYPLLVYRIEEIDHFRAQPIEHKAGHELDIPKGEKGHTKNEKVENFFERLNKACGQSFVKVELIGCSKGYSGKPKLHKSSQDDEIMLYLPTEFRIDKKASKYKISLEKGTRPEQKEKVEELIKNHLK